MSGQATPIVTQADREAAFQIWRSLNGAWRPWMAEVEDDCMLGKWDQDGLVLVLAAHREAAEAAAKEREAAYVDAMREVCEALEAADDLLNSAEIAGLAKQARVKGFAADARKIAQALTRAREVMP